MTTINLYQDQEKKKSSFFKGSKYGILFLSFGVFLIVVLVFIGLKIAVYSFSQQNKALKDAIENEKVEMARLSNLDQVFDMQMRLKEIKGNLKMGNNQVASTQMIQILNKMEGEINNGIVLTTYKYENDKNKVTLTFNANNFNDVAQQVLGFKESDYFSNVNLTKISRGEKAITCVLEMNIKS